MIPSQPQIKIVLLGIHSEDSKYLYFYALETRNESLATID